MCVRSACISDALWRYVFTYHMWALLIDIGLRSNMGGESRRIGGRINMADGRIGANKFAPLFARTIVGEPARSWLRTTQGGGGAGGGE